jgi:BirA family transcriptional regulator, biotin operon repressor / biotin---[acetyl-CoA-carboxylase] ligase
MLSQSALEQALVARSVRYYDSIGSTNDVAMEWLLQGAESRSVVIAHQQTQGRGRLGRTWITPHGAALALSVVLHPPLTLAHRLVWVGALATADVCAEVVADRARVGVKYPNDVQINGLKVAGVLTEAAWQGDRLLGVILGIGVNLTVDFPADLQASATNLAPFAADMLPHIDLYAALLMHIDQWTARLASDDLFTAWKTRLTTLGQRVTVNALTGTAEDVTPDGTLLLRADDGTLHRVVVGDVFLTPPQL